MSAAKPSLITDNEVWLLLDSQIFGGIETHVIELAQGLKCHDIAVRVILIAQYSPTPPIIQRLRSADIQFSYLNELSPTQGSIYQQLCFALNQHSPRLIHAHGYKASLLSKLAKISGMLKAATQVSTYHAGETPTGRVWLYDWLDRYSSFVSNHSLVVSDKIKAKLPAHSTLLNNFISLPTRPQQYSSHIGFVGRLSHEKGADRFIQLAKLNSKLIFDVYGDGPEKHTLHTQASSNTVFHGHQDNMEAVWSNIGVLMITSRFEGLPMAALEAMGRGIPVISLAVGNMPSLIEHETNGFIANSVDELNLCLTQWLSLNAEQQRSIRQNAMNTVEQHYSPQAVIPQLLKCYFPAP
ncbi:glycosyltransferase family 4 protein [Vibrio profundi]|uniref:glycosyltransferase family 4 protein n=1 Tax=Vibrio profundi TaxID=1774960 RepID=UPI003734C716